MGDGTLQVSIVSSLAVIIEACAAPEQRAGWGLSVEQRRGRRVALGVVVPGEVVPVDMVGRCVRRGARLGPPGTRLRWVRSDADSDREVSEKLSRWQQ